MGHFEARDPENGNVEACRPKYGLRSGPWQPGARANVVIKVDQRQQQNEKETSLTKIEKQNDVMKSLGGTTQDIKLIDL